MIDRLETLFQNRDYAAAIRCREDLVRALPAAGADPTMKMDDGNTAADLARTQGHTEVVELLAE